MAYVVTVNQSGYLPDVEPNEYDTLHDARLGLLGEVRATADAQGDGADAVTLESVIEADCMALNPGETIYCAGFAHTIAEV